ncbi:hypothetical protein [Sphaerisporangium fuscum]|uniref:hypothetical protein n=1 Tax=Sphaerisporangium fuscum TaxID=2835868 RepID=UPI0020299561|nr:hypothetical protein [Sphaerisporangium fuscum]
MSRPDIGYRRPLRTVARRMLCIALGMPVLAFMAVPAAIALALPTPRAFVSNLDVECFRTDPYQPPPTTLTLRHLNPVLGTLPTETVTLGPREQLCASVVKNTVVPPPGVIDFLRFVDLSCYRISGNPVNRALVLSHLNPLFQGLPRQPILMNAPQQLCVPVAKNGVVPPPEVLALVRHIDLKCYAFTPDPALNRKLVLRQLNPVLATRIPPAPVQVTYARQLCVPVFKAGDTIPPGVLNIVRWVDLEKYDILAPAIAPVTLTLRHLDPVLGNLPPEKATLTGARQLGVPVAKNGQLPPG